MSRELRISVSIKNLGQNGVSLFISSDYAHRLYDLLSSRRISCTPPSGAIYNEEVAAYSEIKAYDSYEEIENLIANSDVFYVGT